MLASLLAKKAAYSTGMLTQKTAIGITSLHFQVLALTICVYEKGWFIAELAFSKYGRDGAIRTLNLLAPMRP
jgi:hypothetical protein